MQLFPDISYRPHEHVVLARWLQPATDYAHFQASFYQVLEKAVQYDCQYCSTCVGARPAVLNSSSGYSKNSTRTPRRSSSCWGLFTKRTWCTRRT
jgi:hypothetical protein